MSLAGGVYLIIMKTITVSGAIILRESNGIKEIFATQRGYGQTNKFYRQSKNLLQIENHKYFLVSIPSTPAKSSMRFFAGLAFIFCSRTSSI